MDIILNKDNEKSIIGLIRSRRIPHTVIIEGADSAERESAACAAIKDRRKTQPP